MKVTSDNLTVTMTLDEWRCVCVALVREVETSEAFNRSSLRGASIDQIRTRLSDHERVCHDLNKEISRYV